MNKNSCYVLFKNEQISSSAKKKKIMVQIQYKNVAKLKKIKIL